MAGLNRKNHTNYSQHKQYVHDIYADLYLKTEDRFHCIVNAFSNAAFHAKYRLM